MSDEDILRAYGYTLRQVADRDPQWYKSQGVRADAEEINALLAAHKAQAGVLDSQGRPVWGSAGFDLGSIGADPDAPAMSSARVLPDFFTSGGTEYYRGMPWDEFSAKARELSQLTGQPFDALNGPDPSIYDPQYGHLLPAELGRRFNELATLHKENTDKPWWYSPVMLPLAALAAGPYATALGAYGGAAGASAGLGAEGSVGGLGAGGAVEGGMTMAPNFAGMTPMTVGATEYALPALTGTDLAMGGLTGGQLISNLPPSLSGASDPIQAIEALDTIGGGQGATAGAKALGYGSVQDALSAVNPGWVSAGTGLSSLLKSAGDSGGSILSRLFGSDGNLNLNDLTRLLGTLGATGLGYAGAKEQIDAQREAQDKQLNWLTQMQERYLGLGAPYRTKLEASYAPDFDIFKADPALQGAVDQTSNTVLRRLSANGGNPFDSPGGLMEAQRYVNQNVALPQLNTYRNQLGSFGQLGVGTAGSAGLNATNTMRPIDSSGTYDALGYGLSRLTQPDPDPMAMLRQLNSMPLNKGWGF